ncbi:MAG: T9SS type A sorting domain-containing protein [Saprospiraceae bacterium]|nr:T9SS type A sorting domain-containing protein [Saprospiraceae bacterium]
MCIEFPDNISGNSLVFKGMVTFTMKIKNMFKSYSIKAALYTLFIFCIQLRAQDTITLQTLTWDSAGRSYWYNFPDIPADQIERINMIYNMRCHNAAVGNGNVGCYEWDYSCNTFITDTFRTDSIQAIHKKYIIPGITENEYNYSNKKTSNCVSVKQKDAQYSNINNEKIFTIGATNSAFTIGPSAGRLYLLYRADELKGMNLTAGNIVGLQLKVNGSGGEVPFLKIRAQSYVAVTLNGKDINPAGWKEIFFSNTSFKNDENHKFIFHTPYSWNGSSSILLEISYNNVTQAQAITLAATSINDVSIGNNNGFVSLYKYGSKGYPIDKNKMANIKDEVTVAFWVKGDSIALPANTVLIDGVNDKNQRQLNVHLPWGNGSMYWDCGNDGSGFDRIEKAANIKEIEGQWIHWAFTKNSITGIMNIYKNGSLWLTGTGKTKKIQVDRMNLLSSLDNSLSYFGSVSQFSIWEKELDSVSIKNWMYSGGDKTHNYYNSLRYYFPLNDNVQGKIVDESENPSSIITDAPLNWSEEQGRFGISGMNKLSNRPVSGFIQGVVNGLNIVEVDKLEEIPNPAINVEEYEILNARAEIKKIHTVYPAGDFIIFNENGEFVDIKIIPHDGTFINEDLKYQRYAPGKYELLSLVTPYGNGLDLGKEGKTFVFDVTDYAPILRGNKRLSIELGGENQEELNIQFQYIKGKPSRVVNNIQNVYMFQRQGFANILSNTVFEPRKLKLDKESKFFKLRTTITGHEQNGEFTNRSHFIKVDGNKGNKKFDFNVWKECGNNPIYPQGGTWIFDRAGWCPGAASDTYFHDITDLAAPDSDVIIDYGLNGQNLTSANYLVACQLVSYSDFNYSIDAGIENIIRPNSTRVEFERFNPSCSRPSIQIKNFGKNEISSLLIKYGMPGGVVLEYLWTGRLLSLSTISIDLPIADGKIWEGAQMNGNTFQAYIDKVNDQIDENPRNNNFSSKFNFVRSFDFDPVFEIRTNNVAGDNSYRIKDGSGKILIEKKNLSANSTTQENLIFPNGCYTIEVDDRANDGLSFWFYPNFGSGSSSIKRKQNTTLVPVQTFKADFGAGYQYDFIINKANATTSNQASYSWSATPNPASDHIILEIQGLSSQFVTVALTGIDGRIVLRKRIINVENKIHEKLELPQLQSGMYSLQIISNGNVSTKKVFID